MTVVNMFAIRSFLYPLTLVRTRLQAQSSGELYRGTFHAFRTIARYEGASALYKGFVVNSFHLFPHVLYITSYEKVFFLIFIMSVFQITDLIGELGF